MHFCFGVLNYNNLVPFLHHCALANADIVRNLKYVMHEWSSRLAVSGDG